MPEAVKTAVKVSSTTQNAPALLLPLSSVRQHMLLRSRSLLMPDILSPLDRIAVVKTRAGVAPKPVSLLSTVGMSWIWYSMSCEHEDDNMRDLQFHIAF